eukprot:1505591-Amphidinium_carterae.1
MVYTRKATKCTKSTETEIDEEVQTCNPAETETNSRQTTTSTTSSSLQDDATRTSSSNACQSWPGTTQQATTQTKTSHDILLVRLMAKTLPRRPLLLDEESTRSRQRTPSTTSSNQHIINENSRKNQYYNESWKR